MKKIMLSLIVLSLLSINCFAVGAGFGVRYIGMGGTGVALANDTSASYFNPAGLMFGAENFEFSGNLGGSSSGLSELAAALASPDFIKDNFSKNLVANANLRGGLGCSIKKVGFGVIADGFGEFNKPANTTQMDYNVTMTESFPITLGSSISMPLLANMAFGVNIKPIAQQSMVTSIAGSSGGPGTGEAIASLGSGFGFDIGAQAQITPLIVGGVVVRNLASSINANVERKTLSVDPVGNVTEGLTTKETSSSSLPTEIGIGVAGILPITGTILAGDIEYYSRNDTSYSDIHVGMEQKLMFNAIALRIGYFTYGPLSDSFFTYGAGINLIGLDLGFAAANSTKSTGNSMAVIEAGTSF